MKAFCAPLLGAAMLAGLAGCNPFDDPPPCPRVNVLKQAHALTLYGDGPGRERADVAFELSLGNLDASCDYDVDDDEGGGVAVEFTLPIRAVRGPAAETDRVSVPYFVALTDAARRIVAKEVFTAEIVFDGAGTRASTVEEIEQWIPLAPGESGAGYETLVGLQLTPDQLEETTRPKTR